MWTIVRFALHRGDAPAYRAALEILAGAGFRPHRDPSRAGGAACDDDVLPAAVVADVYQDPAVVARAAFEALLEARLRPVAVTGCHVSFGARERRAPARPGRRGEGA